MGEDQIEVIDFSGEKLNIISFKCIHVLIVITILSVIGLTFYIIDYTSPIVMFICIAIIFIVFMYFLSPKDSQGLLRKFLITPFEIEFLLPKREIFQIHWNDFKEIVVQLKIINVKPFNIYHIRFINENFEKKIILTLFDFKKENIEMILKLLKKHALLHRKRFKAKKERIISGVYLVEDMKI
ncbi:MAG: hypothetical protein ACTSUX_01405 [Promethearchaeota archaeon]